MSLHNNIQSYIKDLQDLLNQPNAQALLDKAGEKWEEHDLRYAVLEQLAATEKFDKPAGGPDPESGQNGDQNKSVK